MKLGTIAACCALAASGPAWAIDYYLGGAISTSRIDSGFEGQVRDATASNFLPALPRADMSDEVGGRLFAGASFLPWLGMQVDCTQVGTVETFHRATSVHGAGFGFGETTTRAKMDALGVSAVVRARLTEAFSVFARAGVARTRLRISSERCGFTYGSPGREPVSAGCAGADLPDLTQTRPNAGAGIGYAFAGRWAVLAGWDRYFGVGRTFEASSDPASNAIGKFDVDRFSMGVAYRF